MKKMFVWYFFVITVLICVPFLGIVLLHHRNSHRFTFMCRSKAILGAFFHLQHCTMQYHNIDCHIFSTLVMQPCSYQQQFRVLQVYADNFAYYARICLKVCICILLTDGDECFGMVGC